MEQPEGKEVCYIKTSSRHNKAIEHTNSVQLWLPTQEFHIIEPINILSWKMEFLYILTPPWGIVNGWWGRNEIFFNDVTSDKSLSSGDQLFIHRHARNHN